MQTIVFKLTKLKARRVIKEAMSVAKSIIVDELDCNKSFRRVPTKKTPEEILKLAFDNKCEFIRWHFVVRPNRADNRTDIGCSVGLLKTYFLWIDVPLEKAMEIANKYKLKVL